MSMAFSTKSVVSFPCDTVGISRRKIFLWFFLFQDAQHGAPREPSEAVLLGRGGARERTQFAPFLWTPFALLGMDRFEHLGHQLNLGTGNNGKHITVKVDRAALVFGFWEYFSYGFQHTLAYVSHHKFYPIQASATQPLKETYPTGLVLFHPLSGVQNLTVSVFIHCNCNPNSHVFGDR